jgi:hypothetical protein
MYKEKNLLSNLITIYLVFQIAYSLFELCLDQN